MMVLMMRIVRVVLLHIKYTILENAFVVVVLRQRYRYMRRLMFFLIKRRFSIIFVSYL